LWGVSQWFTDFGFGAVAERLYTGAYPLDEGDVDLVAREGVTRVLNLCEPSEYENGEHDDVTFAYAWHGIREERIDGCVDHGHLMPGLLERAVEQVSEWLDEGEVVYQHCRAGLQRSATAAAAVLVAREGLDPSDAIRRIRRARPEAEPMPHQADDLRRWCQARAAASG
jgi:atypical dual specificity phosphatase